MMNKYASIKPMASKKPRENTREIPVHTGHPKRVLTDPKPRVPTEADLMKMRIKNAKTGAQRSARHAAGRHLSSDAGIKELKRELRLMRNGKRRK